MSHKRPNDSEFEFLHHVPSNDETQRLNTSSRYIITGKQIINGTFKCYGNSVLYVLEDAIGPNTKFEGFSIIVKFRSTQEEVWNVALPSSIKYLILEDLGID